MQTSGTPQAGTPHVRISRDGGRTYPARHARPLPAEPPGQPCTVPVYDPAATSGRMLALDLDPSRGRGAADPAVQVRGQADAITRLVTCLGGRCVTDVAPGGGRHVYVLFAAPLPWRELRVEYPELRLHRGAALPLRGDAAGDHVQLRAADSAPGCGKPRSDCTDCDRPDSLSPAMPASP